MHGAVFCKQKSWESIFFNYHFTNSVQPSVSVNDIDDLANESDYVPVNSLNSGHSPTRVQPGIFHYPKTISITKFKLLL